MRLPELWRSMSDRTKGSGSSLKGMPSRVGSQSDSAMKTTTSTGSWGAAGTTPGGPPRAACTCAWEYSLPGSSRSPSQFQSIISVSPFIWKLERWSHTWS